MPTTSPLNLPYVEALLEQYQADPRSVDESWQRYFQDLPAPSPAAPSCATPGDDLQDRVARLVEAYRTRGHLHAHLDPLGMSPPQGGPTPAEHGITDADLDRPVPAGTLPGPPATWRVRDILALMTQTYCGTTGVEVGHVEDPAIRTWVQARLESSRGTPPLDDDTRRRIHASLVAAEELEQFLHSRFVGAKRFSLEGNESLLPLLDALVEQSSSHGVKEIVMGMPHRGRLNVLVNVLGKQPEALFADFDDANPHEKLGSGDVKYHLGHSADRTLPNGRKVHLALAFNPSHLEWVNPVVLGRVRAKQDRYGDTDHTRALPVLLHGDAAFAGQGLVMETLQLSGLPGYTTGGAIHVVVNNQVGFTTSPWESRSTRYCSDVGKMFGVPILHVNGDDPEAVVSCARLAADFRAAFRKDVIIDLWGYRRHGHNEGDEPSFTQPLMYAVIARTPTVRRKYEQALLERGVLGKEDVQGVATRQKEALEGSLKRARDTGFRALSPMDSLWSRYRGGADAEVPDVDTAVPRSVLRGLLGKVFTPPPGLAVHPKLRKVLEGRAEVAEGHKPLDWGTAETLALASLLVEGVDVRLSGQDSQRGTFAHRHAALVSTLDGSLHVPLAHLGPAQGRFQVINSPLSEAGVLGFDYGYGLDSPDALVIWEAQFGDFANAAQVIVDQFLTSAEAKWNRLCGLVLFLPHGYEGQGPEHSSARVGRYLHLCARDNIQVCNVTTPAQLFHLLRRQVVRPTRKPLVVFTPKSLLRHKAVVSPLSELTSGAFHRVLGDGHGADPAAVKRIILCNGKVYYDLHQARVDRKRDDVAIVRLEQLYPFPLGPLTQEIMRFPVGTPVVWVQEEPWNQGAWHFLRGRWPEDLAASHPLTCVSRPESPSPATGSHGAHVLEQDRIVDQALGA
jgi:2-oxoglutarate dehydrogenase E1 component